MDRSHSIAIIGAGIGGLTAAIALSQKGFTPTIYEKADTLRPIGAGLVLSINAMKALKQLSLSDDIINAGHPVNTFRFMTEQGNTLNETNFSDLATQYGITSVGISRSSLQEILLSAIPSSQIKCGYALENVTQNNGKTTLTFANKETITPDLIIGADGLNSTLRETIFPNLQKRYSGQSGFRGLAKLNAPLASFFEPWGVGTRFGAVQINEKQAYWYMGMNKDEATPQMEGDIKRYLSDRFKTWHDPISTLISQTEPSDIVQTDIYDLPKVKNWHHDNIVFLGDAIHATTPNLGQGAGMAIESALTLAQSLSEEKEMEKAYIHYQQARQKRTNWVINQSWQFGQMAQLKRPIQCAIRNKIMIMMSQLIPEKIRLAPIHKLISFSIRF